jgi:hypothetical protein
MNRDEITRMAREAGFNSHHNPDLYDCMVASDKAIERFAALVAVHTLANNTPSSFTSYQEGFEAGRFAEREACAKVCDDIRNDWKTHGDEMKTYAAEYLANAIRARSQP